MDPAYYTWLILAVIGAVLGVFLRPRAIVNVGVALFVLDVLGFAVAAMRSSPAVWSFGVGAIAIPILTAAIAAGAYAMGMLTGRENG